MEEPFALHLENAYFGGGCFWGIQHLFSEKFSEVHSIDVGYMGGHISNPLYKQVKSGKSGHIEVVRIQFSPSKTSYEDLTKYFFEIHNATEINRQGIDEGSQYQSTIFYVDEAQKNVIDKVIRLVEENAKIKVNSVIRRAENVPFWKGEEYHQHYFKKNPSEIEIHMCHHYKKIF